MALAAFVARGAQLLTSVSRRPSGPLLPVGAVVLLGCCRLPEWCARAYCEIRALAEGLRAITVWCVRSYRLRRVAVTRTSSVWGCTPSLVVCPGSRAALESQRLLDARMRLSMYA